MVQSFIMFCFVFFLLITSQRQVQFWFFSFPSSSFFLFSRLFLFYFLFCFDLVNLHWILCSYMFQKICILFFLIRFDVVLFQFHQLRYFIVQQLDIRTHTQTRMLYACPIVYRYNIGGVYNAYVVYTYHTIHSCIYTYIVYAL